MDRHFFQMFSPCLSTALLMACASSGTAGGATVASAATTVHGVVDEPLLTPAGEIDGLLLKDGTLVRMPPGSLGSVAAGAEVDVQGEKVASAPVPLVEQATVSRAGVTLTSAALPPPGGPLARGPDADARLRPMTETGTVRAILYNREGLEDGFALDGNRTARVPPRAGLASLGVKVGDRITVAGRGATTSAGTGIRAESVTGASGSTVIVDAPPPLSQAFSRDGVIKRVFVNPHGDVDLILLGDGSAIRIRPTPTALASKLVAGQRVRISGDAVGAALHASEVRLDTGDLVVTDSTAPPPPPAAPPALVRVTESSTITQTVPGPRGEVERAILADGAIVHFPPRLASQLGPVLTVGTHLSAEGEGGRYASGPALRADTVRLDDGGTFLEPANSPLPPAGPPGALPPPGPPGALPPTGPLAPLRP